MTKKKLTKRQKQLKAEKRAKKFLMAECNKLWFKILITKNPKCEVCGSKAVQVHHFFYKGNYPHLKYNLNNGISLCMGCHFKLHHHDPKKFPITEQIIAKKGKKWYNALVKESKKEIETRDLAYYRKKLIELDKQL